jgi:hypothetical protein
MESTSGDVQHIAGLKHHNLRVNVGGCDRKLDVFLKWVSTFVSRPEAPTSLALHLNNQHIM